MKVKKYIVQKKRYGSLDEMPADVRSKFEETFKDENKNGTPDIFEDIGEKSGQSHVETYTIDDDNLGDKPVTEKPKENLSLDYFDGGYKPFKVGKELVLVGLGIITGYILAKLGL